MMGLKHGVALVGFMGVGKSTVGRVLATRLGLPFIDTDEVLVQRFGNIAVQMKRDGEAAFRAREAAVVAELCDGEPRVVATGGGAFVDPASRRRLQHAYLTVHLAAPLAVLAERVGGEAGRPLWDASVAARYAARQSVYAEAAVQVDTEGLTPDEVVVAVLTAVADEGEGA